MRTKTERKFKETEIGMIPEDWEEAIFSEKVAVNPSRELRKGITAKYVSMADIEPFKRKISNFIFREFKGGTKFKNGDTLFARITPCLENGKTAFVDVLSKDEVGFGSTEFIVLSAREKETGPYFVYYLSRSPEIRNIAVQAMTGTSGRQRVETDIFNNTIIGFPPLPEQSAIAEILSSLDDKIELNQQMNKTLEQIGQALFKHWFIDFEFPDEKGRPYKSSGGEMVDSELGEIPKGWRVSRIGDEFETILGGTPSTTNKSYWDNGNVAWINSGEINKFRITEPTVYITEVALNNSATKLMPKGTTVLAITGATLGQVSRIEIDACANQSVIGVIESKTISSEYIYFWVKYIIEDIIRYQTGGAQQHINKNNVNSSKILIPPQNILQEYQNIMKPNFDKISLSCFEINELSQIRDSLLPKLMSGKIRVNMEAS